MDNTLPDWAKKHQTKGTQIVKIRENYYLYKISSKWDKKKKRARKVTEKYLGKVTQEGIIKPKHERVLSQLDKISIKEFGASSLLTHICHNLKEDLKNVFLSDWKTIFSFAVLRFFEQSPIKNLMHHFEHSFLSSLFPDADLRQKQVSLLLEKIGSRRHNMVEYMQKNCTTKKNLLVDLTHIFSSSENLTWLSLGHNSAGQFHPQLNMLLLFSKDENMPVYFRLLDGAVKDVSSIKGTIDETGIKDVIFVGDKGFFSEGNEEVCDFSDIRHIFPIRRNSTLIDYSVMKQQSRRHFDGYFFFCERHVWHKTAQVNGKRCILFFDERLKTEEENCFLSRIDKKQSEFEEFYDKEHTLGTIAVLTNVGSLSAEDVYQYLKARTNIEVVFDTFKNILEADKTYMQNDAKLYGWMFINFIALQMYYTLYGILLKKKLLNTYSPQDILLYFSKIYSVKIGEKEIISEVPKTTRVLMEKFGITLDILLKK